MKFLYFILTILLLPICADSQSFEDYGVEYNIITNTSFTSYGSSVSTYDFDQDGWDDITFGSGDGSPLFYRNLGEEGGFELLDFGINDCSEIKTVFWVDVENDGDLDLYVSNIDVPAGLYINNGNFEFVNQIQDSGILLDYNQKQYSSAWGDYNNDGYLDFYVSNYYNGSNSEYSNFLYKNNGDGTFEDVTEVAGVGNGTVLSFQAVWTDYNTDGWQDIFLINDRHAYENAMYKNNGDGTFSDVSEELGLFEAFDAMSNSHTDIDYDGDLDVFISNGIYGNKFMLNQTDTFVNVAPEYGVEVNLVCWSGNFLDIDNDMDEDLYVCSASLSVPDTENYLFINNGNGFDANSTAIPQNSFSQYSSAMGDFNNDGLVDLVTFNFDSLYSNLYINTIENENNYLKVSLEGVVGNKQGIGSNIQVYIADTCQARYTFLGEDYLSQDSGTEIFGLANNTEIDSLIVTWLSGHVDKFYNVDVNQTLHIVEGSSFSAQIQTENLNFCEGDSLLLWINTTDSVVWNGELSADSINVDQEGWVYCEVFNEIGISAADSVFISNYPILTADIMTSDVTCFGQSDGSFEINILLDEILYEYPAVANLEAGVYDWEEIDPNGCLIYGTVEIIEPEILGAEVEITPTQENTGQIEILNISGGIEPYDIQWDNGSDQMSIENLDIGNYQLEITDANGCIANFTYEVALNVNQYSDNPFLVTWDFNSGILMIDSEDRYQHHLISVDGKVIQSFVTIGKQTVSLKPLSPGIYVLVSENQNGLYSHQFWLR